MKITEKIDRAALLNIQIKKLEKEFDELKSDIKVIAKKRQDGNIKGEKFQVVVGPTSTVSIDPEDLRELLSDLDREDEFDSLVKVLAELTKKALGESQFETIADIEVVPFNRISFKKIN